jgi:hypothetical protein
MKWFYWFVCGNEEGVREGHMCHLEGGKRRMGRVKVICCEFIKFVTINHILRDKGFESTKHIFYVLKMVTKT